MSFGFRHSICNEAFDKWPFADACRAIRKAGYTGIELAPFTLAEDPMDVSPAQRREYRDIMQSEGLAYVGMHWLMLGSQGFHVTTPDETLRRRSWQHIRNLIDMSADFGAGGVLVFGSPKQRSSTGGLTREQATRNFIDGLAAVAPQAEEREVTILPEALPSNQSDIVNHLSETAAIVSEIASPAIRTMFDVHNTLDETDPHSVLIERHFELIRHVHVNEMDGKHCGAGDYDFKPVLQTLRRLNYRGWVSLEAFDFTPGAERLAQDSLRHLEAEIERLPS
jgi:D-psicose/D-tagatose/L-ribulose 3-epimerase